MSISFIVGSFQRVIFSENLFEFGLNHTSKGCILCKSSDLVFSHKVLKIGFVVEGLIRPDIDAYGCDTLNLFSGCYGPENKKVPSALLQMALGNTVNYAHLRCGTDTV